MKIIKHEVKTYVDNVLVVTNFFRTKEQALERISNNHPSVGSLVRREYSGEVTIDLYCENCDRDLTVNDTYIKTDNYTRYCSGCYEEKSFTYYTIGGEQVGDENNTEVFNEIYPEVEEIK